MLYQHIIKHCFSSTIGEYGIKEYNFVQLLARCETILDSLRKQKDEDSFPLFTVAQKTDDLAEIKSVASRIRDNFSDLVILGMGGSTLTGQALCGLNQLERKFSSKVRIHFMDSVDPHTVALFFQHLPLDTTAFLAISKSGNTLETIAQTHIVLNTFKEKHPTVEPGKQFFIISDPQENPLRRIGEQICATMMDHDPLIGGRFAALTNVGLLPACVAGLNIEAFRSGASQVMAQTLGNDAEPVKGACLQVALMQLGYRLTVLMPYVERLVPFTHLYRQIWAESLGKNGMGSTPILALGTLDQHSQLQLYLDGPRDKIFTFFSIENKGEGPAIRMNNSQDPHFGYLEGKTLGEIISAQQQATAETLIRHDRPVRSFHLEKLDEEVMGALVMHSMLETLICARLLSVNAFDQPAVEKGKILARRLLEGAVETEL